MYIPRDYRGAFETAERSVLRAKDRPDSLFFRGNAVAPSGGDYGHAAAAATWVGITASIQCPTTRMWVALQLTHASGGSSSVFWGAATVEEESKKLYWEPLD